MTPVGHDCAAGCGSWSAGPWQWRGLPSELCEECARAAEAAMVAALPGCDGEDMMPIEEEIPW